MTGQGYIYVRNWERFQHYKDRRPPWIKLYIDLLEDDEIRALDPVDRWLLVGIWLMTAECGSNGRLRADIGVLARRMGLPYGSRSRNLKRLEQAGFIEIRASKALASLQAPEGLLRKPQSGGAPNGAAPRRRGKKSKAQVDAYQAPEIDLPETPVDPARLAALAAKTATALKRIDL